MKTAEKGTVEIWEERMKKAHNKFAMIKTTKAIYDRVAIIADLSSLLVVQFPQGKSRNRNLKSGHSSSDTFTIKQENISKRDIEDTKYYKD